MVQALLGGGNGVRPKVGTSVAQASLDTQDAFIFEFTGSQGLDNTLSDDCTGDGKNWLGLQLMLVRDELGRKSGDGSWTEYIRRQNTARSCSAVQEIMARICSERINEGIRFTFILEMDDQ